jgi:hypothetical protein
METMKTQVPLRQLHAEHEIWMNELSFYRDELKIFDKYLLDVVARNTGKEVLNSIEHFQNQFIRQKEVMDELSHDIREHEQWVTQKVNTLNPIQAEKNRFDDHTGYRQNMNDFKKIYAEMKQAFLAFLSRAL